GIGGNGSNSAGQGGGGGGGSVLVFSGGTVNILNTDGLGASQAFAGQGGSNTGGSGAAGAIGRSWFSAATFNEPSSTYSPGEESPVVPGTTAFSTASENVITNTFDSGVHSDPVTALSLSPSSGDFLFEAEGSNDNFASDNTGWTTDVGLLAKKRYFKMRLTITDSTASSSDLIDTATISFDSGTIDDF